MKTFFKRFKEPSSWAGLAALAVLFGMPPETANLAVQVVGSLAALVAVALPEKAAQ